MVDRPPASARSRLRTGLARIGILRLTGTLAVLLLAVFLARFGWMIPVTLPVERALYDVRATLGAPFVASDDRIVLLMFTDDTLAATGKRSPLDRAFLARALTNLDKLKPRAIGIDILFDQSQPEDAQLRAAFEGMRTPTFIAASSVSDNSEFIKPWQEAHLNTLFASLANTNVHPASIRFNVDPDDAMRSWPSPALKPPPLLADALTPGVPIRQPRGGIVFRQPKSPERPVFPSFPIDLIADPLTAPALADAIAGRIVLIGADLPDADRFKTPRTRLTDETTAGVEVHAVLVAQKLDGRAPRPIPGWALWIAAIATVAIGAATTAGDIRLRVSAPLIVVQVLALILVPVLLQGTGNIDTLGLPAFGLAAGWLLTIIATGSASRGVGSEQRRFAQSALGKYLPRDVARQILRDPSQLALRGDRRAIYALFTDIEGFTSMCQSLEPEVVAALLNNYLETMSQTILAHGGTIDKFVGDAVVAFWGAPLARPDDAARALAAAVALGEAGRILALPVEGKPQLGRTRVGLHWGEAIVGNFGGEGRIQYTALGDSMNVAARLEGTNKTLKTGVLVSGEAASRAGLEQFRPMGRVRVRGRKKPIETYEPVDVENRAAAQALQDLYARFDTGDLTALTEVEGLAAATPGDVALTQFARRLSEIGPGGTYDLN